MKKVFFNLKSKTILSVVIILSSFSVQGFASSPATITTTEDRKIVVDISDLSGDHATCKIKDQEGAIVYFEKIAQSNLAIKKYDLSQLTPGSYELILEDAMSIEVIKFELTDAEVKYFDKAKTVYKPTIVEKENKIVYFNQLALNKAVNITITKNGEYYYNQVYNDLPTISKKIDFSAAEKGDYLIEVSILGETFYNNISI